MQRQIHAEITRDPAVFDAVQARAADPIHEALAGRLAMLGNAGHLRLPDPQLAARQFLALIAAEMPERTRLGTREIDDDEVAAAVTAGVDTFLRAYAARLTRFRHDRHRCSADAAPGRGARGGRRGS